MFQKFYEDTLVGRFIKRLLRSTNLPILSIIQHNDWIVQDCCYIYDGYIIKALTSGHFCIYPDKHFGIDTYYTPEREEDSYDGIRRAGYKVIDKYDEHDKQQSYNFHSRFMYYDPETHYHLGEYLRYLQDTTGLNLLPYYNCYSGKSIDEIVLQRISEESSSDVVDDVSPSPQTSEPTINSNVQVLPNSSKVLLVPVKYGKVYTIALECKTPVLIQPIIYNNDSGLIIKNYLQTINPDYYSNHEDLTSSQLLLSSCSFLNPFTFNVPNAPNKQYYQQERNLYLAIQVPLELESGLIAIEGNFTNTWDNQKYLEDYSTRVIKSLDPSARNEFNSLDPVYIRNLTLLHFDSKANIAFSDRLIEYLLLSVINSEEKLDGNIKYVQNLIYDKINPNTKSRKIEGVWDDKIRNELYIYTNNSHIKNKYRDLDGYFNKDIEAELLSKNKIKKEN